MILYTKDLVLRTVDTCDINEVARMWEFEKGCISIKEAQDAIDYMQNNQKKNKMGNIYHLCLAVYEKDKDKIIGWCGLDGKTADKLHIFFLIDKHYRNKGYATQCSKELISYAFNEACVPFINGGCDKDNIASFKVMKKSGMREDGFENNGDPLFIITRGQYQSNCVKTPKLIIITGSPCVGKTAVTECLFESYENSAYFDGDWAWCVNPFSIADPRLRNGDKTMSFALSTYLNSKFDYVFFSSVVVIGEDIRKAILDDITATDYITIAFTLKCSEETLTERHKKRGDDTDVIFDWLRTEPHPGDLVIDTDNKTVAQVVDEIRRNIDNHSA